MHTCIVDLCVRVYGCEMYLLIDYTLRKRFIPCRALCVRGWFTLHAPAAAGPHPPAPPRALPAAAPCQSLGRTLVYLSSPLPPLPSSPSLSDHRCAAPVAAVPHLSARRCCIPHQNRLIVWTQSDHCGHVEESSRSANSSCGHFSTFVCLT